LIDLAKLSDKMYLYQTNIRVNIDCKILSTKSYCDSYKNLLNPNYLGKCVASQAQQQQGEQESGCSIEKSITRQVLKDYP